MVGMRASRPADSALRAANFTGTKQKPTSQWFSPHVRFRIMRNLTLTSDIGRKQPYPLSPVGVFFTVIFRDKVHRRPKSLKGSPRPSPPLCPRQRGSGYRSGWARCHRRSRRYRRTVRKNCAPLPALRFETSDKEIQAVLVGIPLLALKFVAVSLTLCVGAFDYRPIAVIWEKPCARGAPFR